MLVYDYTKRINEIEEKTWIYKKKGKEIVTQLVEPLGEVLWMDLGSVSPCPW
jgi:hypothetical protein